MERENQKQIGKKKKSKGKIVLAVILSIFAALLCAAGILVGMNWDIAKSVFRLMKNSPGNNLKAAWIFLTSNSDAIETKINENSEKYDDAVSEVLATLNEYGTGITPEAIEALGSGNYTEEEMIRIISSGGAALDEINREREARAQAEANAQQEQGQSGTDVTPPDPVEAGSDGTVPPDVPENHETGTGVPSGPSADPGPAPDRQDKPDRNVTEPPLPVQPDDTAASIAKLYVVRNDFVSRLSGIEKEITDAYVALPKEEHTPASRKRIAGEYLNVVANLELECDAQVETILSDLTAKLTAQNKDTSVVETIRQAYENEKSLKKAYYLDIYTNGISGRK